MKKIKIFILKLLIGKFNYFVITDALNYAMLKHYEQYKNNDNKILMFAPTYCVLREIAHTLKSIGGEIDHNEIIEELVIEYE